MSEEHLHRRLCAFNHRRLLPRMPVGDWRSELDEEWHFGLLEGELVERRRAAVSPRAALAPSSPEAFVAWFEDLKLSGPGQSDPLFAWLAKEAPREAMIWFLEQELAGEAGFEDLVSLTQVKMPAGPKLELARNYWDEMGQGHASGMHGPMLGRLAEMLELPRDDRHVVEEALALGNLMIAMAAHRRYAFHSIGALGVIELTAPGRAKCVNDGLRRLGIEGEARRYYALHSTLDIKHSEAWNAEVLRPLVAERPEVARAIAEGALIRLEAGARCFARYRSELRRAGWLGELPSQSRAVA